MNVFISHSLEDKILLNAIVERIKEWGHTPKYTEAETVAGYVTEKVERLIDESEFTLLLYTKKAEHSQFINQEIGYIHNSKKPIFVIKEENVKLSGFIYSSDYTPINDKGIDLSGLKMAISKHESNLNQKAVLTIFSIIGGLTLLSAFSKR